MSLRDYVIQASDSSIITTKLAVDEVTKAGFATTWLVTRGPSTNLFRRTRIVEEALFPGYFFATFDVGIPNWKIIPSRRGVRNILGADPLHPTPLPVGAADRLRLRFDAGEFKPEQPVGVGVDDAVMVTEGPFAGRRGVCTMSRADRIKVLLHELRFEIEIGRDALQRAMA